MNWQRARQADQKEARREQIIRVAERAIADDEYARVNMSGLALEAGIAKGTVFLYFPTKETLFLAVAERQFEHLFGLIGSRVVQAGSKREVVEVLASSLRDTPALPKMASMLHNVLEQNVPEERLVAFKHFLKDNVVRLGGMIDRRLSWQAGSGVRSLLNFHTIIIGLYQVANPCPAVARIIESDDLALFRVDMWEELDRLLPLVMKNGIDNYERTAP